MLSLVLVAIVSVPVLMMLFLLFLSEFAFEIFVDNFIVFVLLSPEGIL